MCAVAIEEHGLFVDGEWCSSASHYDCVNPARPWETVGRFSTASPHDVARAFIAADAARHTWGRRTPIERAAVLYRAAQLVDERAEVLARDLTREEGKAIADARGEVARAAAILRYYAGECSQPIGEVYGTATGRSLSTVRVPVGVVCAITPWNFPLAIPAWKIVPALAFGNTVVWKPAQSTPLSAVHLTRALHEAGLPAGALNLVTGPAAEVGDSLLGAAELGAVTFTGSNAVGRKLKERLWSRNVKLQLELGGKNPAVVLKDADLDLASREIIKASMRQTGQRCTATSRVLVERDVYEPLLDRLRLSVAALVVGDPNEAATDVGPLASRAQFDSVVTYLDQAQALGLEIVAGGKATDPGRGYFVDPTIVVDPDGDSPLSREEVFGPVLCVTPAGDAEHALELANRTDYGLSASVFTSSLERAMDFSEGLEAGVVHVNGESTGAEPHVPFGGMKESSSHSREQGRAAREFFTQTKTVYVHA